MLEAVKRVDSAPAEEAIAYVNLARTAVETACLDGLRHIQRSLGLSAFMQGSTAERIARNLAHLPSTAGAGRRTGGGGRLFHPSGCWGVMTAGDVLVAMQQLACADLDTILGAGRALILAPHPDDESLGCGGLIAACCQRGCSPFVVILTDGAASHPGSSNYPPDRLRALRAQEARRAVATLGLAPDNLAFFNYPDAGLSTGAEVSARVARLAQERGCSVILAPWLHDPHCDHEAAAIIARDAARLANCRLLSYPVWGWLLPPDQQLPVNKVDGYKLLIPSHLQAKQSAVAAHASQYSDLIDDSPNGFRLPRELLAVFERPSEVFLSDE